MDLFFNWSIVAFQYCVGFHCTAKWISYFCSVTLSCPTLCHPVDGSTPGLLPTEVPRQQWAFPVLYSRFPLVIHFIHSSVYMSIPNSQFIPPSLPSLVSLHLFSTSVFIQMNLFAKQKQRHRSRECMTFLFNRRRDLSLRALASNISR